MNTVKPAFDQGRLVPTGQLKVVETTVERVERLNGQINATVIFEDELGVRWKIRGYGGGPVAAELTPLEWPRNIRAGYQFKHKERVWYEEYTIVADRYDDAFKMLCEKYPYYPPDVWELVNVTQPK